MRVIGGLAYLPPASETHVLEASNKIADQLGLSDAEREELLPSGRLRLLHNRTHWAKSWQAGLINSPARNRFAASEASRELQATNPASTSSPLKPVATSWISIDGSLPCAFSGGGGVG